MASPWRASLPRRSERWRRRTASRCTAMWTGRTSSDTADDRATVRRGRRTVGRLARARLGDESAYEKDPRGLSARRVFVAAHTAHSTDAVHLWLPRRHVAGSITRVRQLRARKQVHRIPGRGVVQGAVCARDRGARRRAGPYHGSRLAVAAELGHSESATSPMEFARSRTVAVVGHARPTDWRKPAGSARDERRSRNCHGLTWIDGVLCEAAVAGAA